MERFAFKIDSSLKSRLYNLCRLCGMDHPEKIPILDVSSWNLNAPIDVDSEPELSRKIYECVGIEVCALFPNKNTCVFYSVDIDC